MSLVETVFFLLCILLSLHACNGRILRGTNFTHEQGLVSISAMGTINSNRQETDASSSSKTISSITPDQTEKNENSRASTEKIRSSIEARILQERNAAAQEYDSNGSDDVAEDVVVMDYAQPHRKPPIHNEEN